MLQLTKNELVVYIEKMLSNLDISYNLWLEYYNDNVIGGYVMRNYGGLDTPANKGKIELGKKVTVWECGTTCCRIGDLPRAFPIKKEHFGESGFSYSLFCEDVFTPIFNSDVILRDLSSVQIKAILGILDRHDSYAYYSDEYLVMPVRLAWAYLFAPHLNGSKEELLENYPVVVNDLNKILEIIKN